METKYIERFNDNKEKIIEVFKLGLPKSYFDLVKIVVSNITSDEEYDMDPERIHEINDSSYQGTLLYIIAAKGYQPWKYWYVKVNYGSCSGCDTMQKILYDTHKKQQIKDLLILSLQIVEGLKEI